MLVVEGLSAGYGEVNVLSEVSIEVGHNESVAIVGANGAGKSTLVSAICGLHPDAARPHHEGRPCYPHLACAS